VINHHHHLRASPSYSAAPSTEDQGYSWRNVVVSELMTNNSVRHKWKIGCPFVISNTNHYANTNRNSVWPGMSQMQQPWEIFAKCVE